MVTYHLIIIKLTIYYDLQKTDLHTDAQIVLKIIHRCLILYKVFKIIILFPPGTFFFFLIELWTAVVNYWLK